MKKLLPLLLLAVTVGSAQIKVSVNDACADQTGASFVFAVKDAIRGSNTYALADGGLTMEMVCLDPSTEDDGMATAVSIVVSMNFDDNSCFVVMHEIMVVGRHRTKDMSLQVLTLLDKRLTALAQSYRKSQEGHKPKVVQQ